MNENDLNDLNNEQRNILLNFSEITQLTDYNLCRSILYSNNWNLEHSIENYINNRNNTNNSNNNNLEAIRRNIPIEERLNVNNLPHRQGNDQYNNNIFDFLITPLRWLFRIYPESLNPDEDSVKFIDEFKTQYGESGPQFRGVSYSQAVANANRETKFLLIYLHSPLHEDTTKFCRQVLCSERITRILNGNEMIVWGGSIWNPEPYNLSLQLKVSTFPFLALLSCESERSVQILDRIQGFIDERTLVERLNAGMNQGRGQLNRVRYEQRRRAEETLLREEQDREFREALELDRRAQELKQREAELKQQREQEEAQKQELEAAILLSEQLKKESQLQKDKQLLNERGIPTTDENSALIRFQLPHGVKLSRKFWKNDAISVLYAYVRLHFVEVNSPITRIMISTNFPKKDLTDMSMTVEEAGLYPRGALFVQDLDA